MPITRALTVAELAEMRNVKEPTVYAWIKRGELRAKNISQGKKPVYRIDLADAEKHWARLEVQSENASRRLTRNAQSIEDVSSLDFEDFI